MNDPHPHGLIIPEITPDHWVLGSADSGAPGEVINPSGNWLAYAPQGEPQSKNGIETQNCTGFGTLNALETLLAFKGFSANYSDRYLGIAAGTSPLNGNDPHTVAETMRTNCGAIDESLLPFSPDIQTPQSYYQPKPLPSNLTATGTKWYDAWELNHEWVFTGGTPDDKRAKLKVAMTKGTVALSVYAWNFDEAKSFYTKPVGAADNHWCELVAIEDGKYTIFDSYDGYLKDLDPLFDFAMAKVYYLTPAEPNITVIARILDLIGQILNIDSLLIKQKTTPNPILPTPPAPTPVSPAPNPTHVSRISAWATAIQRAEGWDQTSRSFMNNNPGNLKYTAYTKSLGAVGHDGGNFCKFQNYDAGFKALCQFLTDAANNRLIAYHSARTLQAFTEIYAQPPHVNGRIPYLDSICTELKVDPAINISLLL